MQRLIAKGTYTWWDPDGCQSECKRSENWLSLILNQGRKEGGKPWEVPRCSYQDTWSPRNQCCYPISHKGSSRVGVSSVLINPQSCHWAHKEITPCFHVLRPGSKQSSDGNGGRAKCEQSPLHYFGKFLGKERRGWVLWMYLQKSPFLLCIFFFLLVKLIQKSNF